MVNSVKAWMLASVGILVYDQSELYDMLFQTLGVGNVNTINSSDFCQYLENNT